MKHATMRSGRVRSTGLLGAFRHLSGGGAPRRILVPLLVVAAIGNPGTLRAAMVLHGAAVPVRSSEVGPSGSFLVNGVPTVVASLSKFAGWAGEGWLRDRSDYERRLREAKSAGFNAVGMRDPPPTFWTTWHLWTIANVYELAGNREVFNPERIRRLSRDPSVLLWTVHGEFHGRDSNYAAWAATRDQTKGVDPHRVVGDLVMYQAGYPSATLNPYTLMDYPLPEFTLSEFAPKTQVAAMISEAQYAASVREHGHRFVNAASVTVVSEFAPYINGGRPHIPSRPEIFRAFLLLAALNYKCFDVLWGANQIIAPTPAERPPLERTLEELRPAIDRAWSDTLDVFRLLMGPLYPVIVDPAPFRRIVAATPPLQERPDGYLGLYAAEKKVGGATYVIAVNTQETDMTISLPVGGSMASELPSGEPVPAPGGVIRAALPGSSARVYVVH
jgi:hypothetical protein